jgi:threonine/homoserine/homoserine lactone efflux protein
VILLKGIVLGFSTAAPVGVIGTLCIRQSLIHGFKIGLATGMGAAMADIVYGMVAVLGLTPINEFLISYRTVIALFGGLFLCYLGIRTYMSRFAQRSNSAIEEAEEKTTILGAFVSTFFLTLMNPMTLLAFAAMLTGLDIGPVTFWTGAWFVFGVFLGSAFWWLLLSGSVSLFRKHVSKRVVLLINKLSGVAIFLFGLYLIATVFFDPAWFYF